MPRIHVIIHLKPDVLDVEGQAIREALVNRGASFICDVRVGKSIYIEVEAGSADAVRAHVESLCRDVLANPVMESWSWEVMEP